MGHFFDPKNSERARPILVKQIVVVDIVVVDIVVVDIVVVDIVVVDIVVSTVGASVTFTHQSPRKVCITNKLFPFITN